MISYSRQQKALEELAELDKISEQKKKEQEEQNAVELFKQKQQIFTQQENSLLKKLISGVVIKHSLKNYMIS